MSLDGISFSSLGLYAAATPVESVMQTEQVAKEKAEQLIKKTDGLDKIKTEDEGYDREGDLQGRFTDGDDQKEEEKDENESIFEDEEKVKKYTVTFNEQNNMVELISKKTGMIVETISPKDLIKLTEKIQQRRGFLVDREA